MHLPVLQRAHSGEMVTFTELQRGRNFVSSVSAPARWSSTFLILFLFLFFPPGTYFLESNLVCGSDKHVKHLSARKMFFFFFNLRSGSSDKSKLVEHKCQSRITEAGVRDLSLASGELIPAHVKC